MCTAGTQAAVIKRQPNGWFAWFAWTRARRTHAAPTPHPRRVRVVGEGGAAGVTGLPTTRRFTHAFCVALRCVARGWAGGGRLVWGYIMVATSMLTLLQFYWGSSILYMVVAKLAPKPGAAGKKRN